MCWYAAPVSGTVLRLVESRKEKQHGFSRSSIKLGLGVGIFLLTLVTAVIHLYLAFTAIPYYGLNFGVLLFILNGLGYLGLLAALQLPIPQLARFRSAARWAPVGYAALTIVLFFLMAPWYDIIGYVDKVIEVALIALLIGRRLHGVRRAFWRVSQYAHDGTMMVGISQRAPGLCAPSVGPLQTMVSAPSGLPAPPRASFNPN